MTAATADHNPYLAARHVHNERYLSLSTSIRNWQLVAGGLLLANVGLAGGLVLVTNKQQIAPYIVEVDAAGTAAAIRELRAEAVHDPLILSALLKHWITQIRTISSDEELTRRQMNTAYHMYLSSAQNYLTAYYTENTLASLQQRGRTFPVNVTLTPLSPQSWRARCKDQQLARDGSEKALTAGQALIAIALLLLHSYDGQQHPPVGEGIVCT